ncbi:MAG: methyltransferase domain-containing protein [Candidatus Omnitrophota bacterium]|nr:methyltransferase domain-containing protein [Candidatus Omnitrophota bacterium]
MTDLKKLGSLTANIGDMALKRRVLSIVKGLNISLFDSILDCGCGDGLYLKTIKELFGVAIFGFDLNGGSLRLAQGYTKDMGVPLVQGRIGALPYKDNSFSKIFSTEVLEHVEDDLGALKEILRILKPEGMLIITVPNHNYPFLWDPLNWMLERCLDKHIKSGFWAGIWNMHLRLYYREEIEALIRQAGFKVKAAEFLTHYCVPFNHIILYGLKKLLLSGVLPKGMSNTSDKFSAAKDKQSKLIRLGYRILEIIDRGNDSQSKERSCAAILVKAIKE